MPQASGASLEPPVATHAARRFPPAPLLRTPGELEDDGLRPDRALRVATARVVFVDHALLQHDFPALRDERLGVARAVGEELRRAWLLAHAGVVSLAQTRQLLVNTPIGTVGVERPAWRPLRYGRALVVDAYAPGPGTGEAALTSGPRAGLLDLKGVGLAPDATPSLERYANGLFPLGDALRETLFQWLMDEIFARAEPRLWTVPVYGLVDLGFDARTRRGELTPAGVLVRRAHRRRPGGVDLPNPGTLEERLKCEIELLLRHYGITSANRGTRFRLEDDGPAGLRVCYSGVPQAQLLPEELATVRGWMRGCGGPLEADGINIQATRELDQWDWCRAQLVDFGHYEVRPRFEDPLVSLAWGCLLRWHVALWPDEAHFPQPRPGLAVAPERWGYGSHAPSAAARPPRVECEAPTRVTRALAADFRAGRLDGEALRERLRAYVDESVAAWPGGGPQA